MAEGTSTTEEDMVCSLLLHSSVEDSESCQLPEGSTRRCTDNNICHFYLQGRCRYGTQCWHSHNLDKDDPKFKVLRHQINSARNNRRHYEDDEVFYPAKTENSKTDLYETKFSLLDKNSVEDELQHPPSHPPNWVDAPEFVPKTLRSYADTVKCNTVFDLDETVIETESMLPMELCPYFITGECPYDENCPYIHGDQCELCQKFCLNPFDERQRHVHTDYCEKELERDMELSFAIQRSLDKSCGICMDVILEKNPISERRFGILEKCNHVFCLTCIRKWRKVKSFESNNQVESVLDPVVTRACPECRVSSDFITPSQYWFESEEEKKKLIEDYKLALSKKHCKYFKQGKGKCPFGGACFYLHAKPDGTKVELPLPKRRRVRQNQDGELDFMGRIFLWDYLEFREENILMQLELDDFVYAMSDTDDDTSEASDNFFLSESF